LFAEIWNLDAAVEARAGDVADLREKLLWALDNLGELKEKAIAGRKHVQTANDWDHIAEQTEHVYQQALEN
jgi:glycosyltransferase involved in cell wall biosynthesis